MADTTAQTNEAAAVPANVGVPDPRTEADPSTRKLRPRAAYRLANAWNYEQAAARYNSLIDSFPATAAGDHPAMTADLLRRYEEWPDGGAQPSALTFACLAQLYRAGPEDLLDQRDRDRLPPADLQLLTRHQAEDGSRTSLAGSLIGQATAALAFAAAVIYAAGGLSLGLKLWFMKVPWTPVLGQLPRDLIVVTAVGQVVLPCLIAGAAVGGLIDWLTMGPAGNRRPPSARVRQFRNWLKEGYWQADPGKFLLKSLAIAVLAAAVLGAVPLAILTLTHNTLHAGVLQPMPAIYVWCGLFSAVTVFTALNAMRYLYGHRTEFKHVMSAAWRRGFAGAMAALALVPLFCSVSGATLLPPVDLCGQNFLHPVQGEAKQAAGYMKGNLIGSNSQWLYIAQFQANSRGVVDATTITAVPESEVHLQAIGRSGGCGDLLTK